MTETQEIDTWINFVHKFFRNEVMTYSDHAQTSFSDRVFKSEMSKHLNIAKQHYNNLQYKDALTFGFYQIQESLEKYIQLSVGRLNKIVIKNYIEMQALLLAPVYPTISEYVWRILDKPTLVIYAEWPTPGPIDYAVIQASNYVLNIERIFQKQLSAFLCQSKSPIKPTTCCIFVAKSFSGWQETIIQSLSLKSNQTFVETKQICSELQQRPELTSYSSQIKPFLKVFEEVSLWLDYEVRNFELAFNEVQVLQENLFYLSNALMIERIDIGYYLDEESDKICFPGHPICKFSLD